MHRFCTSAGLLASVVLVLADTAAAGFNDCGQPASNGSLPVSADAMATLQCAVGLRACSTSTCDVDASCTVTAADALGILGKAVGLPVELSCDGLCNAACDDGRVFSYPLENYVPLDAGLSADLEVVLGTTRIQYRRGDACVPVVLKLTNRGDSPIMLAADQAQRLRNVRAGIYSPSFRIFQDSLVHAAGPQASEGLFLEPGETSTFGAAMPMDRFHLYTEPPLGGGVFNRFLQIEGPFGVTPDLIELGAVYMTVELDFGDLPDERAPDPGAGVSFVPGVVVVGFHDYVSLSEAENFAREHGCHFEDSFLFHAISVLVLWIPFDRTTGEMIAEFLADPMVKFAERDVYICIPEYCD